MAGRLSRIDSHPAVLRMARYLRHRLPGDARYGDPLSVAGKEPPQVVGQRLAAVTQERPSALKELGFGALQVWQVLSEAQGRGHGTDEVAILFTDLVGFSDWTLEVGDTQALELLRRVGQAIEPPITQCGGVIVKRLGDGVMAVFPGPGSAVEAALEATERLQGVSVGDHRPQLRAGIHVGTPRRLGGDYFGVDVNIAARVAAAAGSNEVLVSEAARAMLDTEAIETKRRWLFRQAKGTPKDLKVFRAERG